MAAAQRLRRPRAGRAGRTRSRARAGPSRSPARKSSTGSVRSPPLPVERTRAPSAISGAPRSPRCAPSRRRARRGCRRPSRPRAPRGRRPAARSARAARRPRRAPRPGTIAPIRTTSPSRARSRRARCGAAAARAPASAGPAAISGIRIVPPANTVMPSPSPNSSTASSAELGTSVSAAMSRFYVRPRRRASNSRRSSRYAPSVPFASIDELESALAGASLSPGPRARDRALPLAEAGEAAAAGRRGGRRQDRGGEGDRAGARRAR